MKFGLEFSNVGAYSDVRLLAEFAVLAERAGWDGLFLWDTMNYNGEKKPVCDPWIALSVIALQTERVSIGLTVAAVPRRRPWKLAREAVTLDHLSRGRFILGVGAGDMNDRAFGAFGEETDARKRAGMLDESLAILQGLWSGQPFSYSGEHYHVDEITFLPAPVQTPGIPIWVGGTWPKKGPMERAARWDGVLPFKLSASGSMEALTPADIKQFKQFLDERRNSDAPFDIIAGGPVFEAITDEAARAQLREIAEAGATWCIQNVWDENDLDGIRETIRQGPPSLG